VVAAAQAGSDDLLFDAIQWFADRKLPLPWPIFWRLAGALGMTRGMSRTELFALCVLLLGAAGDQPLRHPAWWGIARALLTGGSGLTDAAISSSYGVVEFEARQRAAKLVGEARAQHPKGTSFSGVAPLRVSDLAKAVGVSRPTIDRWVADEPAWRFTCMTHETWARLH
jgi:hypothetical protein